MMKNPNGKLAIKNHKYPPPPEPSSNIEPPLISENKNAAMMGKTATKSPMRTKGIFLTQRLYAAIETAPSALGVLPNLVLLPRGT